MLDLNKEKLITLMYLYLISLYLLIDSLITNIHNLYLIDSYSYNYIYIIRLFKSFYKISNINNIYFVNYIGYAKIN